MSRKFKIDSHYYGDDYKLYNKTTITLNPGVTVLVGCNGSGKTTLLHQLKHRLEKEKIPVISFDNIKDGGRNAVSEASFCLFCWFFYYMYKSIQPTKQFILII